MATRTVKTADGKEKVVVADPGEMDAAVEQAKHDEAVKYPDIDDPNDANLTHQDFLNRAAGKEYSQPEPGDQVAKVNTVKPSDLAKPNGQAKAK